MIRAGELREKVVFREPVRISNGSGGFETTYPNDTLSTFAKATELSSNPDLIASQENIKQLVMFTIRYRPVIFIKEGWKCVWRGFEFIVNNIKVDPLRTTIDITVHSEIETSQRTDNSITT